MVLFQQRQATGGAFGNPYTEQLSYDRNGNIKTLQRYGANALIDNLSYTYNGNQATQITDAGTADGFPYGVGNYACDASGNVKDGGSVRIAYNLLNLPQKVSLIGQREINNTYAADGRKLLTIVKEGNQLEEGTKYYNGNLVFDKDRELEYILFDEGRIVHDNNTFTFEYHLKDHLGSTRVAFVPTDSGKQVVQENAYYPFGAPIAALSFDDPLKGGNRYKREGKEYIDDFDWNKYDFGARTFDSWTLRALQIDPLAEKYDRISPYALWGNNPVRFVDPAGKKIVLAGNEIKKTYAQLKKSTSLKVRMDRQGNLSASGKPKTAADNKLLNAIKSDKTIVQVKTTSSNYTDDGAWIVGGGYGGSEIGKDGKVYTTQTINPLMTEKIDKFYETAEGVTALHEVLESFIGGEESPGKGAPTFDPNSSEYEAYKNAHDEAIKTDPRYKAPNIIVDPSGIYTSRFPYDEDIPKEINPEILINDLSR